MINNASSLIERIQAKRKRVTWPLGIAVLAIILFVAGI